LKEETTFSGDAVNIASRIYPLAKPGGICISGEVYDQIKNKTDLPLVSLGKKLLKNLSEPVEIFEIRMPWEQQKAKDESGLPRDRIAVLPFVSMSPDQDDEYFADGLTEELIGRLSLLGGVEVIARTSSMAYKKKEKTANQIGRELSVGTLLEGSVRKAGNRIRVTAQLINANTEGHLWMETYDRNVEDVFAVQTEVAEKVASSLQIRLSPETKRRIEKGGTSNMEAYTSYLKGMSYAFRWNPRSASLLKAIKCFEQAIKDDPNFALAYCGLAEVYSEMGNFDMMDNKVAAEKAVQYSRNALELDASLPQAHASLAYALMAQYDLAGAVQEAGKAVELNPSLALGHAYLGATMGTLGRWSDCMREMDRALELDPLSIQTSTLAGTWYLYGGRYDDAIEQLQNGHELDPSSIICLNNLGLAHIQKGAVEEGFEEVKKAHGNLDTAFSSDLAYAYVKAHKLDDAKRMLARFESEGNKSGSPTVIAGVYAVLGEKDKALDWLERAYEERSGYLLSMGMDFVFDDLRGEPRFKALLEKTGIGILQHLPDEGQPSMPQ
jgi:TolB-like protein